MKKNTRSSAAISGSFIGSPLPDKPTCYTNQDIIASMIDILETGKNEIKEFEAAKQVNVKIFQKFQDINPRFEKGSVFVLEEKTVSYKIVRLYNEYKLVRWKSISKAKSENYFKKLPLMFDILKCTCPIFPCPGGQSCFNVSDCEGWHRHCDCP